VRPEGLGKLIVEIIRIPYCLDNRSKVNNEVVGLRPRSRLTSQKYFLESSRGIGIFTICNVLVGKEPANFRIVSQCLDQPLCRILYFKVGYYYY
jgi:hypothetical protein